MLRQERHHTVRLQIPDRFDLPVANEPLAALAGIKVVVENRGERHDVFNEDIVFLVLGAIRTAGIEAASEDAGKAGFVFLGHVALGLIVFDMANKKMNTEGAVEGKPGGEMISICRPETEL